MVRITNGPGEKRDITRVEVAIFKRVFERVCGTEGFEMEKDGMISGFLSILFFMLRSFLGTNSLEDAEILSKT